MNKKEIEKYIEMCEESWKIDEFCEIAGELPIFWYSYFPYKYVKVREFFSMYGIS